MRGAYEDRGFVVGLLELIPHADVVDHAREEARHNTSRQICRVTSLAYLFLGVVVWGYVSIALNLKVKELISPVQESANIIQDLLVTYLLGK